jgi:hypothetical protein
MGQNRTFLLTVAVSALPLIADIRERDCDVRFVPKADIDGLFDHRVGANKQ